MILFLLTSIMIQLSIFLLFQRLAKSTGKRNLWTLISLALMSVPFSVMVHQAFYAQGPALLPADAMPLLVPLLATFGSLCLVPFLLIVPNTGGERARELVKTNLALQTEVAERRAAEEKLRALSITDELTGLFNRRGLLTLGSQQLKIARRGGRKLILIYADIDNMKQINDTVGHHEGDAALTVAAGIFKEVFRESDIVARIGGDEFVILAVETNGIPPQMLLDRLHRRFELGNVREYHPFTLSISAGTVQYDPQNPCSIEELINSADRLMYLEKEEKQNRTLRKEFWPRSVRNEVYDYRKFAG